MTPGMELHPAIVGTSASRAKVRVRPNGGRIAELKGDGNCMTVDLNTADLKPLPKLEAWNGAGTKAA